MPDPPQEGEPQKILIIIFQIMLISYATLIFSPPLFLLIRKLHLMNNQLSLILIFTAMSMPSTVFILTGFMKGIPYDLEDSGRIDGANEWVIYKDIIMPLTAPSVARRVFLSDSFSALCLAFEKAAGENRRVCFTGCGSTGRLSMILEEMWRQLWEDRAGVNPGDTARLQDSKGKLTDENLLKADLGCSIMTGGDRALTGSTRMQATSMEMRLYSVGGRITYLAEDYLPWSCATLTARACDLLDIFSDTTERSPTFMLRRRPRELDWTRQDYINMAAPEYAGEIIPSLDSEEIDRYLIGNEEDPSRSDCSESLYLHVFVNKLPGTAQSGEKNLVIGKYNGDFAPAAGSIQADYEVPLNLPESPINLWQHLAVKLVFNTASTGSMAMMGRVKQNWMIQVDTTNKKLVDRGCRIISQIVGIPYEEACRELYISLLARERFIAGGGQTILSPVVAALQRRGAM